MTRSYRSVFRANDVPSEHVASLRRWRSLALRSACTVALAAGVSVGTAATPSLAGPTSSVSNVTVTISSPSAAAGALTNYVVTFKASATGGLSGASGSTITVTVPSGTGLASISGTVFDGATQVGSCYDSTAVVAICPIYNGDTVNAGDTVVVTMNDVVNPTAGTKTLTLATTSDTTAVTSPSYTVTATKAVSGLTATISSPSAAAGARTNYVMTFQASSSGGLAGSAGSTITVTVPSGTGLASISGTVFDGATQVGSCYDSTAVVAICPIYNGDTVNAGDTVVVTMNDVVNPTAGTKTLTLATTSDTTAVTSPTYTVTAETGVKSGSVTVSKNTTGTSGVTYTVKFKAVAGLAGSAGSTITITVPSGTNLSGLSTSTVVDAATQVGSCYSNTATQLLCPIYNGDVVNAGDSVVVTLGNLKNPGTTKAYTVKLSTSSDIKVVSLAYCIATTGTPCISRLAPTKGAPGTAVTITGINLSGASAVAFNGTPAAIGTNTATKITTTVPTGATTGTVSVTTSGGQATSPKKFTVT